MNCSKDPVRASERETERERERESIKEKEMVNKKGMGKAVQGGVSLPKEWETTNFQNHFLIVYYN